MYICFTSDPTLGRQLLIAVTVYFSEGFVEAVVRGQCCNGALDVACVEVHRPQAYYFLLKCATDSTNCALYPTRGRQ